ncbi:Rho GTPase activation protein [Umbelopsis sp. PMI_123]|nr:Rho GTPase activation protein [Umbelopsis sp. PMI_123]
MVPAYDWVEIIDPQSKDTFFANPMTGECIWERPKQGTTKAEDPEGDWWELWDENNKLPYYYNTLTGTTEWLRPENKTIIPLMKIQVTATWHFAWLVCFDSSPSSVNVKRHSRSLDLPVSDLKESEWSGIHHQRSNSDNSKDVPKEPAFNEQPSNGRQSQFSLSRASIESAFLSLTKSYKSNSSNQSPATRNNENKPLPPGRSFSVSDPIANRGTPTLPVNLQREITQFAIDGFAKKYFSTHKKGLFRRKVPMEQMLQWTKDSIKQPLMMLNKDLHKDALKSFKLIQMIMGDRSRPRNTSANEDLQWLCNCGITQGQMRDEIYVQVCKQLNNNPNNVLKGWEILCVITITFPPSKNLESYLTEFVKQHHDQKENKMDVMSQHVSSKLTKICSRGAKGKVLTVAEIERAKDAPFKPSVFGETLEFIMEQQASTTDLDIPKIVPFLSNMVLDLRGLTSEGIFRVPGDADDVTELRIRIENGRYESTSITDPNVPASLLKYWLRDLANPLILTEYYELCIKHSEDINQAIEVIRQLPDVNRRIVLYMANFLAKFTTPESTQLTRMNVNNLAMVFAPNFLRCPYDSLTRVFENSKWEQAFLRTLIENSELLNEKL